MKIQYVLLLWLAVAHFGCGRSPTMVSPPPYRPENFRADITSLIDDKQYGVAVAYLNSADPKRQAAFDKQGYLGVGYDTLLLPGVEAPELYYPPRDWLFPGTQDAIQDEAWQKTSTAFAEQYNLSRAGK